MTRKRFSQEYRTYGEWLNAQPRESRYARRIIRFHERFPDKSLKDLKALRLRDYDLSESPWNDLSPEEKRERLLSLELLRAMRKGEHFSPKLRGLGLSRDTAVKHLGLNLRKERGYWHVTLGDRIEAEMLMYDREKGKIPVLTARSTDRTRIAQYHAFVRIAIERNNPEVLRQFEQMVVIDAAGNRYQFVTDLDQLFEIKDAEEEPEFFEVYQS
jgi:hypothetical protein